MRILIITPYYSPDLGPSAPLFTMLSEALIKRGYAVSVLTTVPHYPSGQVSAAYQGKMMQQSTENGVQVFRLWLPSVKRSNLFMRLLQFVCYQVETIWAGFRLQYDVVLVANPALWVWLPFVFFVTLKDKPAIFSIHDVYPDVGVTLGIFRSKPVIAMVSALERYCLNHSVLVRILSESFKPGLQNLGVPETKMALVYDWVDTDLIQPLAHCNKFTEEHALTDHFIVLYAGNIGLSQGLENVLAVAKQLSAETDIQFLFVGDGLGRESLVAQTQQQGLTNVQFLPFQPRERLPEVLACADISLVILKKGIGTGSLPSKTFSILASARPIIASVDEGSETWNLIQKAKAGLCIAPENPSKLAEAILTLRQDRELRKQMGCHGRIWAEQKHSLQSASEQFEKLLKEAIAHVASVGATQHIEN
jgi:colanic acid biosynthesis glycosyl transferase WcaI